MSRSISEVWNLRGAALSAGATVMTLAATEMAPEWMIRWRMGFCGRDLAGFWTQNLALKFGVGNLARYCAINLTEFGVRNLMRCGAGNLARCGVLEFGKICRRNLVKICVRNLAKIRA